MGPRWVGCSSTPASFSRSQIHAVDKHEEIDVFFERSDPVSTENLIRR